MRDKTIKTSLGEIGVFANGINKDKNAFGHGVPFVNLLDVFGKADIGEIPKGLVEANQSEIERYKLVKDDILFIRSSVKLEGVGAVSVISKDLKNTVYSGFIIRFRQEEKVIDTNFGKYYLNFETIRKQIIQKATLSANSNINQESLKTIEIEIPFIPQQRKIAHILTTCDAVIEKTEAAITKYQAIKQGMMHDLFTRGIDLNTGRLRPKYEDAPELYKQSELGWIPKEWEVMRLEEIVQLKSGDGITSKNISEYGDYPVYGGNGLRGYTDKYTHDGTYVLIGRQGALCGNITFAYGKFFASEHAVVVTILNDSHVKWIEHKLYSMNLNQYSEASAQPGLSVNKIVKLRVVIPHGTEQTEIANRLSSLESKNESEQSTLSKYRQIKAGLMQDLLSGKVEVKVDEEDTDNIKN